MRLNLFFTRRISNPSVALRRRSTSVIDAIVGHRMLARRRSFRREKGEVPVVREVSLLVAALRRLVLPLLEHEVEMSATAFASEKMCPSTARSATFNSYR